MMKWTHVCPLLGVALFACATGENENPDPFATDAGGSDATAGSQGTAGSSAGSAGVIGGSSSSTGGTSASGSSTGGSFSFSGASSFAGSFGTAATGSGGVAGGGTGTAGGGGAGGKASGGGGAGGKASGGAGGKASGGAAGAGGGGNATCTGTIPAKTTWQGTASKSDAAYPPAKAFDGDNTTRWATGTKQVGGEWLQIDFGAAVSINEITLFTNNDDYFRHYELRLSNTSQDFGAPILKAADGVTGSIVVPLASAKAGQFLTIRQTGANAANDIAWWSLHEVSVACK